MRTFAILLLAPLMGWGQVITTVAGNGTGGEQISSGDGGPATSASVTPNGVTVDSAGNIYIADVFASTIRKVNRAGIISTVAGYAGEPMMFTGDGVPATQSSIYLGDRHNGLAVDKAGNLYIADYGHNRVRKVDTSGIITTVAGSDAHGFAGDGGPATSASLFNPSDVALDSAGNLYIADTNNFRIRKVDTSGNISTFAGTGPAATSSGDGGPATKAALVTPLGVAVDKAGNIYIADQDGFVVRKVNTQGIISTVAGNGTSGNSGDGGPATSAQMASPYGVAVDGSGNIYIADYNNSRVREVSAGIMTTAAGRGSGGIGDGGPPTDAGLDPAAVAVDSAGNLYIADIEYNRIRKVTVGATPLPPPSISANGIVNGASFQQGIVPGSWATIQGSNLSAVTDTWAAYIVDGMLPTQVDNVSVMVGGESAYVYYVSAKQINFIVPPLSDGEQQVVVTTSSGMSAPVSATVVQFGPAFFAWPNNQVVATFQNFSYAAANGTFSGATTTAAKPGDTIILWGTGFGPTKPAPTAGQETPSNATYNTATLPTVTIDNVPATVYGAALAPGFAGLYQLAIQVPESLGNGNWPVVVTIGGVSSPSGLVLAVQQ
jgi:uncharacterized protein (TIGR03437 family)